MRLSHLLALLLVLTACAVPSDAPEEAAPSPTPASSPSPTLSPEPVLRVMVTVETLADLVAQVGGDRVEVSAVVPSGADAHTYEPRPRDVVGLTEVDVFFAVGLDLNPAVVALAEQSVPDHAPVVRLGELLSTDQLIFDHVHDHSHDHGHDHDHSHDHDHGHVQGSQAGPNPHVWTSLRNAIDLVDHIATVLADVDHQGADYYRQRAADYQRELQELHTAIAAAADTIPAGSRTLVTYHDAWSYFARDYGLKMVTAVQPSDYAEPSAGDVRAVIDLIREHDVPAIFGSEEFPAGVLETIAAETGATYVGDLADDVLPGEPGSPGHTYLELMRRNAHRIVSALGGDASGLE